MKLKISLTIFLSLIMVFTYSSIYTKPISACNCLDLNQFWSELKSESIILYVKVNSVEANQEIVENDIEKIEVTTQEIEYETLNNISNSNIEYVPIISKSINILEVFDTSSYCGCGYGLNESVNAYNKFKRGEHYILFLKPENSSLLVQGSIKIDDGKTVTEFVDFEVGTDLDKLVSKISRTDLNDYVFEETQNSRAGLWFLIPLSIGLFIVIILVKQSFGKK